MTVTEWSPPDFSVPLWPGTPPGYETVYGQPVPTLCPYLVRSGNPSGAIVVLPGGGYGIKAAHEAEPVARWLNSLGISAFVLDYRVAPYRHPIPLLDSRRAIQLVRHHAREWSINPAKVGILGFSAGGHLASTTGTHFETIGFGEPDETDWLEPRSFPRLPDDEPNPDDDPSLLHTRKGSPNVTVVLLHRVGGRLCLDKSGKEAVSLASKLELGEAKRLFARSVKLSRYELTRNDFEALKAHRKSQGLAAKLWSETPLLAHAHPVVLEAGRAALGELVLELHPELGVVYVGK